MMVVPSLIQMEHLYMMVIHSVIQLYMMVVPSPVQPKEPAGPPLCSWGSQGGPLLFSFIFSSLSSFP